MPKGKLAADLSVMPLIWGTDYLPLIQLSSGAAIAPGAGDPHGALVHAILAINPKSPTLQVGAAFARNVAPGLNVDPFSWLGQSASIYVDDDPFWEQLARAEDAEKFFEANYGKLPIGLRFEVSNGFKLAAFLTALHGFIDQSAPQMTTWQNLNYNGRAYVKIAPSEQARGQQEALKDAAIYYVADGDSLLVTPNESLLKHAIDRKLAAAPSTQSAAEARGPATQPQPSPTTQPWLGTSLCFRGQAKTLDVVFKGAREEFQSAMQQRAWQNLPILNEWKRRYPDQDPLKVHRRFFQALLLDPAGASYTWNEQWQTMESTVYGNPGAPRPGPERPSVLSGLISADFGLTFEDNGLRARAVLERKSP